MQILRRHLLEHEPVSDICDDYDLSPTVFYRWQKQFFQQGAAAFENGKGKLEKNLKKKVSKLEEKIAHKDEVQSSGSGYWA